MNSYPLLLKQRKAKQLEILHPFDKALKCGCFGNVKKFQGSLGKRWGHAKRVQKSDILTTGGLQWCRIGLKNPNQIIVFEESIKRFLICLQFGFKHM